MQIPLAGIPPQPSFADQVRAEFWQLQVPALVLPALSGQGAEILSDFGDRLTIPDAQALQFFLAGYRLGERAAEAPPPWQPTPPPLGDEEPPSE